MNRFFIEPENIAGDNAALCGEDVKHITRVLRLGAGDAVTLCDGQGFDYEARIERADKSLVELSLLSKTPSGGEPRVKVALFQGLPKAGKMETIVQKCVELGVSEIVPFAALRSVVRLDEKDKAQKRERYARVALEAAKQARRGVVPRIGAILPLKSADLSAYDLLLIAYEEEKELTLKTALRRAEGKALQSVGLIVGPEGGLEKEEVAFIKRQGGVSITLGKRILRTETAGMALIAMLLYELEG